MRRLLPLALLLSPALWAEEPAVGTVIERHAIEQIIRDPAFSTELPELAGMVKEARRPLSGVSMPRLAIKHLRFVTPEVALAQCEATQYGSMIIVRRMPLLVVLRHEVNGWRVFAVHPLAQPPHLVYSTR